MRSRVSDLTASALLECRLLTGVPVSISGVRVRLHREFPRMILEALHQRRWEQTELQVVARAVEANDVVLEFGAGLGIMAAFCAKRIGSRRVFAYEANPWLEPYIRETFSLNGVSPELHMCLVTAAVGRGTLYVEESFGSSSVLRRSPEARPVAVPMRSLDDELRRTGASFLVVDVEGGEHALCHGSAFSGVRTILMELHEHVIGAGRAGEVLCRLRHLGFGIDGELSSERVFLCRRAG